ncbi:hypothetical protein FEM08_31710 [Flavobacterium gilvum]|nr:hypothetical protein FEM08_31710 [Flavobacterium gilvum]
MPSNFLRTTNLQKNMVLKFLNLKFFVLNELKMSYLCIDGHFLKEY